MNLELSESEDKFDGIYSSEAELWEHSSPRI